MPRLTWEAAEGLEDVELERRLYPPTPSSIVPRAKPDAEYIHVELRRPGVTLELLHFEYGALQESPPGLRRGPPRRVHGPSAVSRRSTRKPCGRRLSPPQRSRTSRSDVAAYVRRRVGKISAPRGGRTGRVGKISAPRGGRTGRAGSGRPVFGVEISESGPEGRGEGGEAGERRYCGSRRAEREAWNAGSGARATHVGVTTL
jgi:hypothetical protein